MPSNEEFQEEFSITSNVRSFTVRAGSVDDRNDWLEAINSAIEEQQNRQSTFNPAEDGMPTTLSRVALTPEESLGDVAPVWIPDQRVAHCQVKVFDDKKTSLTKFLLTKKHLSGLQCEVPADGETPPLPVLRRGDVQSVLCQQGADQVPAV